MKYDKASIKQASLIVAVSIGVLVLTTACSKISSRYNVVPSSDQRSIEWAKIDHKCPDIQHICNSIAGAIANFSCQKCMQVIF